MSEWWLMHWGPAFLPPSEHLVWGWPIAIAYVFAGTSGMIAFLAAMEIVGRRAGAFSRVGLLSSVVGVMVGVAILLLDLGVPWRFLNLVLAIPFRVLSSPMTLGVTVLGILPVAGVYCLKWAPADRRVAAAIAVLGVLTAVYPGFLLNATSIALWNMYLPLVFLSTSLSAGAAFMALVAGMTIDDRGERQGAIDRMERIAVSSTAAELVFLCLFIFAAAHDGRAVPSLRELVAGSAGIYFWGGLGLTVAAGLGLLFAVVLTKQREHSETGSLAKAFVLTATGSFFLRASLFLAGYAAFAEISPFGSYTIQLP